MKRVYACRLYNRFVSGPRVGRVKFFLTGGSGFIGNALLRRLLDIADEVRLLVRPQSPFRIDHPQIKIFRGTVTDAALLRVAMQDCDGLFHLAARAGVDGPDPMWFEQTNVEGTRQIIKAAFECKVKRIVYTSSIMTFGATDGTIAQEESLRRFPYFTDYERSKALAEETVHAAIHRGLPVVIVSPTFVYGPSIATRADSFNAYVLRALTKCVVALPGDGFQVINPVYIEDVVQGHLLAFKKGVIGEKYILGGENVSISRLIGEIGSITKIKRCVLPIPLPLLKLGGWIEFQMARMQRRGARLTPSSAEVYRHDWAYSSEKAGKQIDYKSRSLRSGL